MLAGSRCARIVCAIRSANGARLNLSSSGSLIGASVTYPLPSWLTGSEPSWAVMLSGRRPKASWPGPRRCHGNRIVSVSRKGLVDHPRHQRIAGGTHKTYRFARRPAAHSLARHGSGSAPLGPACGGGRVALADRLV